ncbi:MAG: hypothetical protein H6737_16110 [Alphaproteobacteria bacterium]|nr:hypothetical protein [Alphaproteobacteria bacterium]
MEAEAAAGTSFFILYLFVGVGQCITVLLGLYNLVAIVGVMRSEDEGSASGMAKGAWATGCLSAVLIPCAPLLSLVAIILSRIEIGRVYRDESPLASATPARMGSVNGGVALLVFFLVLTGAIVNLFL